MIDDQEFINRRHLSVTIYTCSNIYEMYLIPNAKNAKYWP